MTVLENLTREMSILLAGVLLSFGANAQSDMQQAQTLGAGKGQEIFTNVTSKMPTASSVPGYNGSTQQQSQYFQGGKGEIVGPGQNRAGGCVTKGDPECTAVNLLTWGPDNRAVPTFSPTDPLLTGARARMANAKNSLGTFSTAAGTTAGALTNLTTQCSPTTVVTPATYQNSICDETAQLENKTCLLDQTVVVNGVYDYTCEKSTAKKTTQTCNKTLSVTCSSAASQTSCPNGSTPYNGRCRTTTTTTESGSFSGYNCPAGTSPSGSSCISTTTISGQFTGYYCAVGYVYAGSCVKDVSTTTAAVPVYGCPGGYTFNPSNGSCWTYIQSPLVPVYLCSPGWVFNDANKTCSKDSSIQAASSLSCPSGTGTYGTNVCLIWDGGLFLYYLSQGWTGVWEGGGGYIYPRTTYAPCPSGYTASGSYCVQTVTQAATVSSYTCPTGYTNNGSSCVTTQTVSATITDYTCPTGSTRSGTNCVSTTTQTISAATPVYTCPSGYTKNGSTCTLQTSVPGTPVYTCRSGGTLNSNNTCTYILTTDSDPNVSYSCPTTGALTPTSALNGTTTYSCCADSMQNACTGLEARAVK
jgi:hypothetical protein